MPPFPQPVFFQPAPPPGPPPPHLAWSEHISSDGVTYFYNVVTGESRWERPDKFLPPPPPPPLPPPSRPAQLPSLQELIPRYQDNAPPITAPGTSVHSDTSVAKDGADQGQRGEALIINGVNVEHPIAMQVCSSFARHRTA
jgi:hypothetical protein